MIATLVWRGLRSGKARFFCAAAGMAVATASVVFTASLVRTNARQAPLLAERAVSPWAAWSDGDDAGASWRAPTVRLTADLRPGGRVLQGPPVVVMLAPAPASCPYGAFRLAEGRWPDDASDACEVVCVRRALTRSGRLREPPLGSEVTLLGRTVALRARVVGYLDGPKLPRRFPSAFANARAFAALAREKAETLSFYLSEPSAAPEGCAVQTPRTPAVAAEFAGDEQRRMDYAAPLLLAASVLTALALLVNSLLLSIESNRPLLSTLRLAGLTRAGVVRFVFLEAVAAGGLGWAAGVAAGLAALSVYVAADPVAFPAGAAFDGARVLATAAVLPFVIAASVLLALRPALAVRAMEADASRPRRTGIGMCITFALGFAAFVAVEVWGASLMRAFVPSPEWPDAIVSILPGGASSFDVERLRTVEGVRRVSELVPRQYPLAPECRPATASPRAANALFLAAEFLPPFVYVDGTREAAEAAVRDGRSVVVTEMMARACALRAGGELVVSVAPRRGAPPVERRFPVVGVVSLNWHMVTSRGLVRGLNGASPATLGPVFCSLDTMGELDPRTYVVDPALSAPMTHLWVDYEPSFLSRHGVFGAGRLVEAEIARRLDVDGSATVRLHARDEIADGTLAHGSSVIGQAARVPFVFLAILALGFVAMLVAQAEARRRTLAVLRAVGATRLQVAWILARAALGTALAGMAAGLPLGALAGWLFTFGTGRVWPGLPHYFVLPVRVVCEGAAGALAAALAVAVPTALVLVARKKPSGEGEGERI